MQGRADQFERIVEILRTAVVTTQITPDNVARIRDGRIKIAKETVIAPEVLADRAIAARLFGDFPYGRPPTGSAESLARVDRADLLLARERFLNANNATLTIMGGVASNRAIRALRQLLGPWRKSEQIVPTTFRQPLSLISAPSSSMLHQSRARKSAWQRVAWLARIAILISLRSSESLPANGGKSFRLKTHAGHFLSGTRPMSYPECL